MKTVIDIKSVLLGLGVGVMAMFVVGAELGPTGPAGRFEISACPGNPNGFAMILDTATGRVWMGNGTANQLRSDPDFFDVKLK